MPAHHKKNQVIYLPCEEMQYVKMHVYNPWKEVFLGTEIAKAHTISLHGLKKKNGEAVIIMP